MRSWYRYIGHVNSEKLKSSVVITLVSQNDFDGHVTIQPRHESRGHATYP